MTNREMCEWTARVFNEVIARDPGCGLHPTTGETIWNQSSRGELWPVYEAYDYAKRIAPALGIPVPE